MGIDIRSILRVGLLGKEVSAGVPFLEAADVERNQPWYEDDDIRPNTTGIAIYTVEFCPSTSGDLSVVVSDGTTTKTAKVFEGVEGELNVFNVSIRSDWTLNFSYSVDGEMDIFVVTEHGGYF